MLIRDEKGNVLKSEESDITYAKEILDLSVQYNTIWFEIMYLDSESREIINLRKPSDQIKIHNEILNESSYFHQLSCTIPKIDDALTLTQEINNRFIGKLSAYSLIYGETANIDIVKYGVSKASALYEYANMKNIKKTDIITVGDNFNDIPMITEFDGSIMDSAIEQVKNSANHTCKFLCEILR